MSSMNILMIHEVEPWMFDLDYTRYDVITFDDGLYTQYLHREFFQSLEIPLVYFISTGVVCTSGIEQNEQNVQVVQSELAHRQAGDGDLSAFMTWAQIKELYKAPDSFIGGHSHTHPDLSGLRMIERVQVAKHEVQNMIATFEMQKIRTKMFAYPYNSDLVEYRSALPGFQFFGPERIDIRSLRNS